MKRKLPPRGEGVDDRGRPTVDPVSLGDDTEALLFETARAERLDPIVADKYLEARRLGRWILHAAEMMLDPQEPEEFRAEIRNRVDAAWKAWRSQDRDSFTRGRLIKALDTNFEVTPHATNLSLDAIADILREELAEHDPVVRQIDPTHFRELVHVWAPRTWPGRKPVAISIDGETAASQDAHLARCLREMGHSVRVGSIAAMVSRVRRPR